jgi:selenocysteine lyase/cysteine desulfurase
MLDINAVRAAFPFLEHNVYLNTAAAGLSWNGQGRAAAEFYDSGKSKGMGGAAEWAATVAATKAELAELVKVPAHCIHFVGSTTEALNLVAHSLVLNRGDQVVLAADEFPSVLQSWESAQRRGVELVQVPISHESDRTEALAAAVSSGVKALAVSHIHWRTGTRVELSRLSARCREHGCLLIVDGVQAVGAVPVQAAIADAYCASVFKWLLAGFGLGFVIVSEQLSARLQPEFRGYNNEAPSRSLRYGHINYPGVYALHASLQFMSACGWEAIYEQVDALALRAIASLRDHGFEVITPPEAHGGIVSIQHPRASALVRDLSEQSIFVEDRGPVVRVSPHFYNTAEDIDRFVSALARSA